MLCNVSIIVTACIILGATVNAAPFADGRCVPGQTYILDCNTCTCTENGKNMFCTLMACSPFNDIALTSNPEYTRDKRDVGDYDDPNQDFVLDEEQLSPEDIIEQQRQVQLLKQQAAEDKRRLALEQAAEQQELRQQQQQMQEQLDYQKALDDLQRAYDEAQQHLDAQQDYTVFEDSDLEQQAAMDLRKNGYYRKK